MILKIYPILSKYTWHTNSRYKPVTYILYTRDQLRAYTTVRRNEMCVHFSFKFRSKVKIKHPRDFGVWVLCIRFSELLYFHLIAE